MRQRHWKQQWDPNADLVFSKRLKLGLDPENPWVEAGDPVPKCRRHKARHVDVERRVKQVGEYLGIHRLYMWWRAGIVELAEFECVDVAEHKARRVAPEPEDKERRETSVVPPEPEPIPPGGYPPVEPGKTHPGVRKEKRLKIEHKGAGWYVITSPDGEIKVRGKAKAEAKLAELAG